MKKKRNIVLISYLFLTAVWIIWFILSDSKNSTKIDWPLAIYTLILVYIWCHVIMEKVKLKTLNLNQNPNQEKMKKILDVLGEEFTRVELKKANIINNEFSFSINEMFIEIIENENILFYAKANGEKILLMAKDENKIVYHVLITNPIYFENHFDYNNK